MLRQFTLESELCGKQVEMNHAHSDAETCAADRAFGRAVECDKTHFGSRTSSQASCDGRDHPTTLAKQGQKLLLRHAQSLRRTSKARELLCTEQRHDGLTACAVEIAAPTWMASKRSTSERLRAAKERPSSTLTATCAALLSRAANRFSFAAAASGAACSIASTRPIEGSE